jgi:hypothetical protein
MCSLSAWYSQDIVQHSTCELPLSGICCLANFLQTEHSQVYSDEGLDIWLLGSDLTKRRLWFYH